MDPYENRDPYARRGFADGGDTTSNDTTAAPPSPQVSYLPSMQRIDPRDPYGRGDPYAFNVNRDEAERFRQEYVGHRKDIESQRQQAEAKEQYNADQMSTILDQATAAIKKSREGRSNLALMTLGANMMGPGNFGDQLG